MSAQTNVTRLLQQQKIPFEVVTYAYQADKLQVEQIAQDNQLDLSHIFKTLVTKGKNKSIVVALVSGEQSLSLKKLAQHCGFKKMALVAVKNLQPLTAYIRGGCSPIGMKKDYPVLIDQVALSYDKIYINAGKRGVLVGLSPMDLQKVTSATFASIAR